MSLLEHIIENGNRIIFDYDRLVEVRPRSANWVLCADGTTLSVIAGAGTYCQPGVAMSPGFAMDDEQPFDYPGPYTAVEVGYPTTWRGGLEGFNDGEGVAGHVPVDAVRTFVANHGGEANETVRARWEALRDAGATVEAAARAVTAEADQ